MKIQWVTAIVVAVSLMIWAVLAGLGKTEAAGLVTVLGFVLHALLPALVKSSDGVPPAGAGGGGVPAEAPTVPVLPSLKRMALGFGFACFVLAGCGPSAGPTPTENAIKASPYGVELGACVANSATKAESVACRCRVNQKWNRPCTPGDGGLS